MNNTSTILLLHGIWQRPLVMIPLAHRLRRAGHRVELFGYSSVRAAPEATIERLRQRVLDLSSSGPVHLVGHSMGGVLSVRTAHALPDAWQGRVVCLGSPLQGSSTARNLAQGRLTRALLGAALPVLTESTPAWTGTPRIAVIAGTRRWGVGRMLHRLDGDHDGTVAVSETMLPGIHAHRTIGCSHTTLVHNRQVVAWIDSFLREGRFCP